MARNAVLDLVLFHIAEIFSDQVFRVGGIGLNLRPFFGEAGVLGLERGEHFAFAADFGVAGEQQAEAFITKEQGGHQDPSAPEQQTLLLGRRLGLYFGFNVAEV